MFEETRFWRRGPGGRDSAAAEERRVWVRFPHERDVTLRTSAADTEPVRARVRDLSRGGVGLVVDHGYTGADMLNVELPTAHRRTGGAVLAYVLRAVSLPGGAWSLGCAFATELDDDALSALGGCPERTAEPDRRDWGRIPARGTARFFSVGTYCLTHQADILDVSPGGVGLVAGERVEPGSVLSVELTCPGAPPRSALAGVMAVRAHADGRWVLGCSFIREMAEDEFCGLTGAQN
jgi:hypothetical protein